MMKSVHSVSQVECIKPEHQCEHNMKTCTRIYKQNIPGLPYIIIHRSTGNNDYWHGNQNYGERNSTIWNSGNFVDCMNVMNALSLCGMRYALYNALYIVKLHNFMKCEPGNRH